MTPSTRAEIQAILSRLADGDRAAIEPAFAALWPVLRRFAARALPSEADAEDAAQQALTRIYAQAASFDPSRDGLAWALTIASYECLTLRRKTQRRREQPLDVALEESITTTRTPEVLVMERDLESAAREVLGTLRDEDVRTILEAMTESRRATGATLRKRLQRALGRLRVAWRAKHETE